MRRYVFDVTHGQVETAVTEHEGETVSFSSHRQFPTFIGLAMELCDRGAPDAAWMCRNSEGVYCHGPSIHKLARLAGHGNHGLDGRNLILTGAPNEEAMA